MTTVLPVRFEHLDDTYGIGVANPRLSWQVTTEDPTWVQTAYELSLHTPAGPADVIVESADQVLVPWPFAPLASRSRATVRVRVRGDDGWTEWSDASPVEVGLLSPTDWSARFISPATIGGRGQPAPLLSRAFALSQPVASARLYITAHGVYDARLNGTLVSEDVLAPGWTSYHHRLNYRTHDVTDLLTEGDNRIEVVLGDGWYRGRIGAGPLAHRGYGDRLALLAQLEITYADGSQEVVATDQSWAASESGILEHSIYDGQHTDLRPQSGAADAVEVVDEDLGRLVAPPGPPVRVTQKLDALKVWTSPSGQTLVDFGQNLVGWVQVRVRKPRDGHTVTVRHAEVLEHEELGVRPLRTAKATDTYILAAGDEAVLEPRLTFHGFRYAQVDGVDDLQAADVTAVVVGSDLRRTGWFSCSDPDLNRLHDNVLWSMRGNFLSIPTDCPQRDERLGWTGDLCVFSPTASFLYDVGGFLSSWLADVAVDQQPDGAVPFVVPQPILPGGSSRFFEAAMPLPAAWGDAATIYQRLGDTGILAHQLPSMMKWVDAVAARTVGGVSAGGFQFGDWLDPTAPPEAPGQAKADPTVIATAYLARSADIVAQSAAILGDDVIAERYAALAQATRDAFGAEFVTSAGRVVSDAPTVYALALEWGLLPTAAQRDRAARRLADLVIANGFEIATGFVGTPLMTDALASTGRPDLAYRLLLERGCPSWLYPVTMGATTIWERWDSMLPDGTINPGQMTSFNHYALGAVADWMHRAVAGLAPGAPGYREIIVRPLPDPALSHASARLLTPYGEASVAWRRQRGTLTLDVVVPPGARAVVSVPGGETVSVGHGSHSWSVADPVIPPTPISTIRDLIGSPVWEMAVASLVEQGCGTGGGMIAKRVAPYLDLPALDLPRIIGPLTGANPGQVIAAGDALVALLKEMPGQ